MPIKVKCPPLRHIGLDPFQDAKNEYSMKFNDPELTIAPVYDVTPSDCPTETDMTASIALVGGDPLPGFISLEGAEVKIRGDLLSEDYQEYQFVYTIRDSISGVSDSSYTFTLKINEDKIVMLVNPAYFIPMSDPPAFDEPLENYQVAFGNAFFMYLPKPRSSSADGEEEIITMSL